ncbi:hypothetical protein D3C80_1561270 [compost metagenome]
MQLISGFDQNGRHTQILQDQRGQDAGLNIFADRYNHNVEVADTQRAQRFLIGGICGYGMGYNTGYLLGPLFVGIDSKHIVPHAAERLGYT